MRLFVLVYPKIKILGKNRLDVQSRNGYSTLPKLNLSALSPQGSFKVPSMSQSEGCNTTGHLSPGYDLEQG